MTDYLKPSFSVPQRGREPTQCTHGWTRDNPLLKRRECVTCGAPVPEGP